MVTECGLILDIETPYIGASPDGLICCSCCGKGVLEVKCPLYVKDKFPEKDQDSFCMKKVADKWLLKEDHAYYYQVQTQMHVCKRNYCDFIVWSEKAGILIHRVQVNPEFFDNNVDKLQQFFTMEFFQKLWENGILGNRSLIITMSLQFPK